MDLTIDNPHIVVYTMAIVHDMGNWREVICTMRLNIEAERGRLQLTKGEISKILGVTPKTYNGYIAGSPIPSNVLEELHRITGCSIDYLLGLPDTEG